jgi:tetratricopeptide (TPR) repeat protein
VTVPSPASLLLLAAVLAGPAGPQATAPKKAPSPAAVAKAPAEPAMPFEEVAKRAANARQAEAAEEAAEWYRRGVRMRPAWEEGWWYLGSLAYGLDRHAEARDAFTRFLALKPDSGPAWALRGLAEFRLKQYDQALRHLSKGMALGSVGNAEIRRVVYYHFVFLRLRAGQFELAVEPLRLLARTEPESAVLLDACGLLVLRDARLPADIPPEKAELVRAAGAAAYSGFTSRLDEMRERFDALLARYPDVPNLHYAYGVFMMDVDQEKAIAAHKRETEIQPDAVMPRLELAFAYERIGAFAEALPWAEQAAKLAPGVFAARYAVGRALVETGQVSRGVAELEAAVRLAPESSEVRFGLAKAYTAAGRTADAAREQETFLKLQAGKKEPANQLPGFARDLTTSSEPPPTP